MIVVDTNIIAYWLLPGEKTELVTQVWRKDPDWIVPLLWQSEIRNVLAVFMQQGRISLTESYEIMVEAERLLADRQYTVSSNHVLQLAYESGCSAYDCEFIALARQFGLTLVTADRRLQVSFPDTAVLPEEFCQ